MTIEICNYWCIDANTFISQKVIWFGKISSNMWTCLQYVTKGLSLGLQVLQERGESNVGPVRFRCFDNMFYLQNSSVLCWWFEFDSRRRHRLMPRRASICSWNIFLVSFHCVIGIFPACLWSKKVKLKENVDVWELKINKADWFRKMKAGHIDKTSEANGHFQGLLHSWRAEDQT